MEDTVQKVSAYIALHGLNVIAAGAIFFIGCWLADFISDVIEKVCQRQKVDPTLTVFSKNLIYYALLGVAGFAVGMALQGSLANFAAGVMIILFRPFCVGDAITAGGVTVGISYEDDIKKACKIVLDLLASDVRVLKNPAPAVVVSALADSGVNLTVKSWVKITDYDAVLGAILENIKEAFDQTALRFRIRSA